MSGVIQWDKEGTRRGGTRCFADGCEEERFAYVLVAVRVVSNSGQPGSQVASRQRGFCKAHAEQLFERILSHVEGSPEQAEW